MFVDVHRQEQFPRSLLGFCRKQTGICFSAHQTFKEPENQKLLLWSILLFWGYILHSCAGQSPYWKGKFGVLAPWFGPIFQHCRNWHESPPARLLRRKQRFMLFMSTKESGPITQTSVSVLRCRPSTAILSRSTKHFPKSCYSGTNLNPGFYLLLFFFIHAHDTSRW